MAQTQADINSLLAQFMQATNGQQIDYYGYPGECLSLVKKWVDVVRNGHLNGPMGAPISTDGWGSGYYTHTPDVIRELFDIQPYSPNAQYPAGSLGVNTATHHIFIFLDNQPGSSTARVYEQNADLDGSPAHEAQRSKARIDGVLSLKLAPDAPEEPLYTVTAFSSPKRVKVAPGHSKWNLAYANFNEVAANPITTSDDNTVFNAVAVLHHREIPQYNYYLEDANTPHGWNVLDCTDYTPPPAPYVPPAAPMQTTPAEKYTLVTSVMTFSSASEAIKHSGVAGALVAGDYFVIAKRDKAYNLSNDNMKDKQQWVNTDDNVLETPSPSLPVDIVQPASTPVDVITLPAPVEQGSAPKTLYYDWINGASHQPVWYHTQNVTEQRFKDLENPDAGQAILPPNKDVRFSMVTIKGGMNYYIPTASLNAGHRHGIPETLLKPVTPTESFLDTTELDISDWAAKLIETPKKVYGLISDIAPARRNKLIYQSKQFIDGFKSKSGSKK